MAYPLIEDHGIIGDLYSTALVARDGTIDFCCLPNFDSPSVFASLLDDSIGGWFRVEPRDCLKYKQMYLPDTAILLTRAYTSSGLGQVEDFMPIVGTETKIHQIIRRISCVRGSIEYAVDCRPAFDYARASHQIRSIAGGVLFETEGGVRYGLMSSVPLEQRDGSARATIALKEGELATLVFFAVPENSNDNPFAPLGDSQLAFEQTTQFWHNWLTRCTYRGRWSDMIRRSAITLKLLTFGPTGAIVAAPTFGLPESVGGTRNWDYRYTWIRDASFTLYAFMRIGFTEEAVAFMQWLAARCGEAEMSSTSPLNIMYGIHGDHILLEQELNHLKGYRDSRPVRIGNAAHSQLQLDIYGELMDSVYLYQKYVAPLSYELWNKMRRLADWVAKHWEQPDEGIWEMRSGRKAFVFSRLMSWVALDRACRIALRGSLPGDTRKWAEQRDKIYDQIMTKGWNPERQAFRQHFDSEVLDAANLLMPMVKFISAKDPRMDSTINETLKYLTTDSLTYRYDPKLTLDGLPGEEGTFCMCTFWLVEALTRAGRLHEAQLIFQKMLGYANHLGLYGEEIGQLGETLGNFPQAFTHLSLISAAYNLDHALNSARSPSSEPQNASDLAFWQ